MESKQYFLVLDLYTSCFNEDDVWQVNDLQDLDNALCGAKIRFDTHPKNYTKLDYMYLVDMLKSVLTKLYQEYDPQMSFITTLVGIANTNTDPKQDVINRYLPDLGTYLVNKAGTYTHFLDKDDNPISVTEEEANNIVLFVPTSKEGYYNKVIYKIKQDDVRLMHDIPVVLGEGKSLGKYVDGDIIEVPLEGLTIEQLITQIAQESKVPEITLNSITIDGEEFNLGKDELIYLECKPLNIVCKYTIVIKSIAGTKLNKDSVESFWIRNNENTEITEIKITDTSNTENNELSYECETKFIINDSDKKPNVHKNSVLITLTASDMLSSKVGSNKILLKWENKVEDEIKVKYNELYTAEENGKVYISSLELPLFIIEPSQYNNGISIEKVLVNDEPITKGSNGKYEFIETEENSEYLYVIKVEYSDGDEITKTINIYNSYPMFFGYMPIKNINSIESSMSLKEFQNLFVTQEGYTRLEEEIQQKIKLWQIPFLEDKNYYKEIKFDLNEAGAINNYHAVIAYPTENEKGETGVLTEIILNNSEETKDALNVLGAFSDGINTRIYEDEETGETITAYPIRIGERDYYIYYSEDPTPFNNNVHLIIK